MALMGATAGWAQTAPTAGAVVAAGDFYLYNIGAGTYMAHGSSYGTHVTVDGQGDVINLAGEGNYTIHLEGVAADAFLGKDGWVDCVTTRDDYSTFTFEPATKEGYTNVYKIKADKGGAYLNWMGGGGRWTNEARFEAVDNEDWGLWLVIPKATRQDVSGASESNPIDVTYLITNPDFEANPNDNNTEVKGWTTGFKKQFNGAEGMSGVFLESWTASTGTLGDFTAEQTLKNLPAGIYQLSVKAAAIKQGDGTVVPEGFTMFAGTASPKTIGALDTYSITFVSTGTDVTIGMKTVSTNVNWVRFDNFRLAYMGVDLSILKDSYAALSAKAAELDGQTMSKVAQDALTAAISETATVEETEEALTAAIDKLTAAIKAAEKSIAAYANAAKYLPINKAELEGTNLYTWDAYKQYISDAEDGLADGTLSDELAAKMTDVRIGYHAANYIDDILMSAWDADVEQWDTYHVNTWSTEGDNDGSNFKVPFIEYWTNDDKSLGTKTLTATLEGYEEGDVYDVTAWVRVRIKNGAEAPATGITMQVCYGKAVDVCDGTQVGSSQFYLKEYVAQGAIGEDGKLVVKFDVAADNNVSWMSFKNVFFTFNEEATAIKSVATEQSAAKEGIYNLAGQRVQKAGKGLYIINGKKVVK
jgi:hypothetical protein